MNGQLWEKQIMQAEHVRLLGRYDAEKTVFSMYWPGSGIQLRAACTTLLIELEADYETNCPWIIVLIDGAQTARFPLQRGRHVYAAAAGMNPAMPYTVSILRDTQPVESDGRMFVCAHAIRCDGELLDMEEPALRFELVGDSLTSGEGLAGPKNASEWGMTWMSIGGSWGLEVCRALGAQGRWISQSGWGAYAAWDGSHENYIARIYDQVCAIEKDGNAPYDFAANPVDAVIVNLGTNDMSAIRRLEGEAREEEKRRVAQAVEALIARIRGHNPQAYILWTFGMCGYDISDMLRGVVAKMRRAGDRKLGFLQLPECKLEDIGSRSHPGLRNHEQAAKAVVRRLKKELNLTED